MLDMDEDPQTDWGVRVTGRTSPGTLPQPGLRLMGVASIGVGSGLFGASASVEVLALAFAPALIALIAVAVQSTFVRPLTGLTEDSAQEAAHD